MPVEVASVAFMAEHLTPAGGAAEGGVATLSALAERARAGDAAAFEQLMVCTQHKVAATAWRLLGSREDARDATQESYLRAYKYLKSYRPGQDFHGWLYRITVNVCRDMMRTRRGAEGFTHAASHDAGRERDALEAVACEADTEGAAVLAQQRAIVRRALETLPEKERTAVVLRDLEGLSTEEVARLMKTRPATVRSQVSTARTKLKLYCERFINRRRD
jgi:RNA polymerase sigma-70 factor (ECF subfamily)